MPWLLPRPLVAVPFQQQWPHQGLSMPWLPPRPLVAVAPCSGVLVEEMEKKPQFNVK
jgi:hypothetical protein